ncbi:MAG: hypothetical protein U0031_10310 [Thermomicrobiales bacterium]
MRRPKSAAPALVMAAVVLLVALMSVAPVAARQNGTPAAGTPAAPPTQAAQPTQPAAAPTQAAAAATPAAQTAAQTNVVTLVFWYANAADQDILNLFPIAVDAGHVAGPKSGAASVGTADFLEEGGATITIGDTTFTTYPRADGSIDRWTWFDDFEGARPATLVMQLSAAGGAYEGYYGAATFVSRAEGGAGGVLIIVLRPPAPAGAEEAAAEGEAAAEAQAADAAAIDSGAETAQPDATVEPANPILTEPGTEGEAPVDVVTEPSA